MTLLLASLVLLGIAVPHALPLQRARPVPAAAIWASALILRTLTAISVCVYLIVLLPGTTLFDALTHWCWENVLPMLASSGGLDGRKLGDVAVVIPAFLLAFSLVSAGVGVLRAGRAIRRMLSRSMLGDGPRGSVIVGGPEVILAAAGLARPRVIVSAGALINLDDDELAAALDHERGHIARRHRYVLVLVEVCRALARPLPGTRSAVRALRFQLERDADRWAVSRRNEPEALASAICKAALPGPLEAVGLARLTGGGMVTHRVGELMDPTIRGLGKLGNGLISAMAVAMAVFAIALTFGLPATTAAAASRDAAPHPSHCPDDHHSVAPAGNGH